MIILMCKNVDLLEQQELMAELLEDPVEIINLSKTEVNPNKSCLKLSVRKSLRSDSLLIKKREIQIIETTK